MSTSISFSRCNICAALVDPRHDRRWRKDGHDILECPSDRKSTRLNSSHVAISYAVFCLKKKMADGGIFPARNRGQEQDTLAKLDHVGPSATRECLPGVPCQFSADTPPLMSEHAPDQRHS